MRMTTNNFDLKSIAEKLRAEKFPELDDEFVKQVVQIVEMATNHDLKNVIEKIRAEKFPEIPANLVELIIDIESENIDNRSRAAKEVDKAVEKQLNTT